MDDRRIPADAPSHLAPNQLQGQNRYVAGDYQEGVHREVVPRPVDIENEIQYPPLIDAPNLNVAYYHPPPPPYPGRYPHAHQHDGVVEPVPVQAYPFAPGVQDNRDDYGARFPAADPPAPPADMPPAANGLIDLIGLFLNNPGTLVNMLRIKPDPDGRFDVWIALELADIRI